MDFISQHPNYKGYSSSDFYVSELPPNMGSALQGYILTQSKRNEKLLKMAINEIASFTLDDLTTNWGWDFLCDELPCRTNKLCNLPLHKVMDFFTSICSSQELNFSIDSLNALFDELKFGYTLTLEGSSFYSKNFIWEIREEVSSNTESIETVLPLVKDICSQTLDHLKQAQEHLLNKGSSRDDKDAIRDCLSAMETLLKKLANKNNIGDATKKMLSEGIWGQGKIVNDGLSIWELMHKTYPDVRHGNPKESTITDEEALYWIERIMCFVKYISRMHRKN
ncbi:MULTISPECIES: hypothetical protein [Aminobacterium]|uniref:hypothetical protein n=1 Tax=Aminobacterium TaxID=81466 RepID=UPI00257FA9E2|nr:hypothetical protein [Aminobacterium sp. UBA4834]